MASDVPVVAPVCGEARYATAWATRSPAGALMVIDAHHHLWTATYTWHVLAGTAKPTYGISLAHGAIGQRCQDIAALPRTTGFLSVPSPSMVTATSSPASRVNPSSGTIPVPVESTAPAGKCCSA